MAGSNMSGSEWLLEVALMVMLAATMFHAFRLERALGVLRRDRAALEELVTGFNDSTRQAEDGIERLRAAADGAGRQIARHVDQARGLKSDLEFLMARGEKVCDQLEGLVRSQKLPEMPAADPSTRLLAPAPPLSLTSRGVAADQDIRPRSQAEKDLLRALRSAR
jgi:hypothetical protein